MIRAWLVQCDIILHAMSHNTEEARFQRRQIPVEKLSLFETMYFSNHIDPKPWRSLPLPSLLLLPGGMTL